MLRSLFIFAGLLPLSLTAKTYTVDGIVVAVDPSSRTMLVSHREIAHYMPAMMMPFRAQSAGEISTLHPGVRITFQLEVSRDKSLARNIRPSGGTDAVLSPSPKKLAIGASLPQFELTDQSGNALRTADLRGKVVAIDFIYTRCPLPDVCPRLSANFAMLRRRFGDQVLLLSVTVDPDYDTPAVLAEYAHRWSAGPNWKFLTGDVSTLAESLGELYWAEEGSIGHNSTTSIIGRDGRLAAQVEGSNYRPDQLAHLIARQLEARP